MFVTSAQYIFPSDVRRILSRNQTKSQIVILIFKLIKCNINIEQFIFSELPFYYTIKTILLNLFACYGNFKKNKSEKKLYMSNKLTYSRGVLYSFNLYSINLVFYASRLIVGTSGH